MLEITQKETVRSKLHDRLRLITERRDLAESNMKNTSLDPELRKMNAGQELELYSETNFVLELLSDLDKPEPTPTPDRVLTSLERAKDAFLFADLAQYESEQDRLSDNAKTLALFSIADSLDIIAKALDSGTLLVKDVDKY